MFDKFVSRFRTQSKAEHPLASKADVEAIISDVPSTSPERALFDLDHWLAEAEVAATELAPDRIYDAVVRLDEAAAPLVATCLQHYFDAKSREHLSEQWWQTLYAHCKQVPAAYAVFLRLPQKSGDLNAGERRQLAQMAIRSMYWLMQGNKLLRLRYRGPDEAWWQSVHALLARAHGLGLSGIKLRIYDEIPGETTIWHEYALGLYFELAPLGNLAPTQIETLDQILRPMVNYLGLKADPTGSNYAIDLTVAAAPVKLNAETQVGNQWRFLNTTPAYNQLLRLAAQLRAERALPNWLSAAPTSVQEVEGLFKALIIHWSREPPKRRRQRQARDDELLVVHGFPITRRMVAFSDFARSGRSIDYQSDLSRVLRERMEQSLSPEEQERLAASRADTARDPLEVLRSMELSGDRAMMEKWKLADISEVGLGATTTLLRNIHRIGGLVGYRFTNQLDWRLGLIRRLGRSPNGQAGIGLETLPGPSFCAQVKPMSKEILPTWQQMEGSGLGYLDALLVANDGDELILPLGAFIRDLPVQLRVGTQERDLVLTDLRERGTDFDRVRFRRAV